MAPSLILPILLLTLLALTNPTMALPGRYDDAHHRHGWFCRQYVEAPGSSTFAESYVPGRCGIHVQETDVSHSIRRLDIYILDNEGNKIADVVNRRIDLTTLAPADVQTPMENSMQVQMVTDKPTVFYSSWGDDYDDYDDDEYYDLYDWDRFHFRFQIGDDIWRSDSDRCSVGNWDKHGGVDNGCKRSGRHMDCGFAC